MKPRSLVTCMTEDCLVKFANIANADDDTVYELKQMISAGLNLHCCCFYSCAESALGPVTFRRRTCNLCMCVALNAYRCSHKSIAFPGKAIGLHYTINSKLYVKLLL